jgi:hypothetical protein
MQICCTRDGVVSAVPFRKVHLQGRRLAALSFRGLVVLAACAIALSGTGCRRGAGAGASMPIKTVVTPQPVRVGIATVTVTGVIDGLGEPLAGVHVQIEGDMAHPGMAPVFADAYEGLPGVYTAQLDLNMPGDWVVLTHIRLANGQKIERQIDVRGVQTP